MKKILNFAAGLLSGAAVGASVATLLAPASGEELREEARARWEEAVAAAQEEMEETRRVKTLEYERMKEAGKLR